jgi:hypothetical protein
MTLRPAPVQREALQNISNFMNSNNAAVIAAGSTATLIGTVASTLQSTAVSQASVSCFFKCMISFPSKLFQLLGACAVNYTSALNSLSNLLSVHNALQTLTNNVCVCREFCSLCCGGL